MSSFWILLELRMMEMVSGDNWKTSSEHQLHSHLNTFLFRRSFPDTVLLLTLLSGSSSIDDYLGYF